MKDDPKVKQLNNIRVQLENLSHGGREIYTITHSKPRCN